MRKVIVLGLALFAFGCSSSHKNADTKSAKATAAAAKKSTSTPEPGASAGEKVTCTNKGDIRTIEVRAKDKGCELAYTKSGNETIVATSNSGSEHCAKVQGRIQDNLKTAGFSCE